MALQGTISVRPVAEALARAQGGKSYWARVRERLLADPVTVAVMALLLIIIVMAAAAPLIATYDPTAGSAFARLKSPGYPSQWSRMLYGGRLTLLCGVAPVTFALLVGGSLGLVAGYRGGLVNSFIMRGMDVLYAFPDRKSTRLNSS